MVRSISWKILPGSFGKMDKIASARNAISETPYNFLPKVQRQQFICYPLVFMKLAFVGLFLYAGDHSTTLQCCTREPSGVSQHSSGEWL